MELAGPELPEAMRGMFQRIAECKPSEDGRRLLIASSSHGAAVIDRAWSASTWTRRGRTPWPHAVSWDAARQLLWADSQRDVVGYRLTDWGTAALRLTPAIVAPLPDINGHDMMPVPHSPNLILATAAHTWLFDRDTHQFAKHPRLGDAAKVKSVHVGPASKRLLWVQGEGTV